MGVSVSESQLRLNRISKIFRHVAFDPSAVTKYNKELFLRKLIQYAEVRMCDRDARGLLDKDRM